MIKPTAWRASEPRLLNSALFHGGIFHQMQMISLHGWGEQSLLTPEGTTETPCPGSRRAPRTSHVSARHWGHPKAPSL